MNGTWNAENLRGWDDVGIGNIDRRVYAGSEPLRLP